ncbi:MAG TPA: DUF1080 domain-containing protein [Gemmataceae bacterium]|nr:DUF1080 domain-containing protein [Gemmataceae bacterium]
MLRLSAFTLLAVGLTLPAAGRDDKPKPADGFTPMFNGRDLTGWVNVNCHPSTFFVKDGEIVTTGKPTGFLRTEKQYENFELEMEWMHVNKKEIANSGLFVWGDPLPGVGTPYTRGIEVQVLINYPEVGWATNHGDIFSIWGAKCTPDRPHPKGYERCLPSENRVKGGGEWNHYKVIANDGVIKLHVNGKEVSGVSKSNPRKGYLALESEGAECHFKNIKIKELPSTNPKPEEVAKEAEGHVSLFNGMDLKGWTAEKDSWKAGGGILRAAGKAPLTSDKLSANGGILLFDWKVPAKSSGDLAFSGGGVPLTAKADKPGAWKRTQAVLTPKVGGIAVEFQPSEGLEIMNVFFKELPAK